MAKIKGGYYIKAKKIQESDIAHAPPHVREIWDWLLLRTNWKDTDVCKRGELLTSYDQIRDGLHWMVGWRKMTYSKWDCEKAMKVLLKATMVATRKTTRGMFITVLNYDKYQNIENYEGHKEDHTKATREPQTTDTIQKETKRIERKKEEKNTELIASAIASADIVSVFDIFKVLANPNYGNKTQRKAIEELIASYGLERTLAAAKFAVSVQSEKYAPVITNPYQLKAKFGELVAFKARQDKTGSKSLVAEI